MDCRHLCAFAEDMSLRELTDDEVVVVAGDKRVLRAMKALGDLKNGRSEGGGGNRMRITACLAAQRPELRIELRQRRPQRVEARGAREPVVLHRAPDRYRYCG